MPQGNEFLSHVTSQGTFDCERAIKCVFEPVRCLLESMLLEDEFLCLVTSQGAFDCECTDRYEVWECGCFLESILLGNHFLVLSTCSWDIMAIFFTSQDAFDCKCGVKYELGQFTGLLASASSLNATWF